MDRLTKCITGDGKDARVTPNMMSKEAELPLDPDHPGNQELIAAARSAEQAEASCSSSGDTDMCSTEDAASTSSLCCEVVPYDPKKYFCADDTLDGQMVKICTYEKDKGKEVHFSDPSQFETRNGEDAPMFCLNPVRLVKHCPPCCPDSIPLVFAQDAAFSELCVKGGEEAKENVGRVLGRLNKGYTSFAIALGEGSDPQRVHHVPFPMPICSKYTIQTAKLRYEYTFSNGSRGACKATILPKSKRAIHTEPVVVLAARVTEMQNSSPFSCAIALEPFTKGANCCSDVRLAGLLPPTSKACCEEPFYKLPNSSSFFSPEGARLLRLNPKEVRSAAHGAIRLSENMLKDEGRERSAFCRIQLPKPSETDDHDGIWIPSTDKDAKLKEVVLWFAITYRGAIHAQSEKLKVNVPKYDINAEVAPLDNRYYLFNYGAFCDVFDAYVAHYDAKKVAVRLGEVGMAFTCDEEAENSMHQGDKKTQVRSVTVEVDYVVVADYHFPKASTSDSTFYLDVDDSVYDAPRSTAYSLRSVSGLGGIFGKCDMSKDVYSNQKSKSSTQSAGKSGAVFDVTSRLKSQRR